MTARNTEKDYHNLAKEKGWKWVGLLPQNTKSKTKWRCGCGVVTNCTYQAIERGKQCPACGDGVPKIEESYHNLAKKKGGKWIGERLPEDTHEPTEWECENGHRWMAHYNSIKYKTWCPHCSAGKSQETLRCILEDALQSNSSIIRPEWLRNPRTKHKFEIDIYFPDFKLAVEYNGAQHYIPIDFFGGQETLERIQKSDEEKRELIKKSSHVETFIIFTYEDVIDEEHVRKKLEEHGIL